MKIFMRQKEHPPRRRPSYLSWDNRDSWDVGYIFNPEEKKEATVRYRFTPGDSELTASMPDWYDFFNSSIYYTVLKHWW